MHLQPWKNEGRGSTAAAVIYGLLGSGTDPGWTVTEQHVMMGQGTASFLIPAVTQRGAHRPVLGLSCEAEPLGDADGEGAGVWGAPCPLAPCTQSCQKPSCVLCSSPLPGPCPALPSSCGAPAGGEAAAAQLMPV